MFSFILYSGLCNPSSRKGHYLYFDKQEDISGVCGTSTDPVGECTKPGDCNSGVGGTVSTGSGCGSYTCCQYTLSCSGITGSSVFTWQNPSYPSTTSGPVNCDLTVVPKNDTCFIRVEFLDTLLSAPTPDSCIGNSLIIYNQMEGNGSQICSTLTGYETFVRVPNAPNDRNIRFHLDILDQTHKYQMKITQLTCDQVNGIVVRKCNVRRRKSLNQEKKTDDFKTNSNKFNHASENQEKKQINIKNEIKIKNDHVRLNRKRENFQKNTLEKFWNLFHDDTENVLKNTERQPRAVDIFAVKDFCNNALSLSKENKSPRDDTNLKLNNILEDDISVNFNNTLEDDISVNLNNTLEDDISVNLNNTLEDDISVNLNNTLEDNISVKLNNTLEDDINLKLSETLEDDINSKLSDILEDDNSLDSSDTLGDKINLRLSASITVNRRAPYNGYFMSRNDHGHNEFCGAVLINPMVALTTASCVLRNGYDDNTYANKVFFTRDGEIDDDDFDDLWDEDTGDHFVDKVIFHPMYDHDRFRYDFAVLKLATPENDATPILLPPCDEPYTSGDELTHMGFGLFSLEDDLDVGDYLTNARRVTTTIMSNDACNSAYSGAPNLYQPYGSTLVGPELFCFESGSDVQGCEGDQGSPVVDLYNTDDVTLLGLFVGNQHLCLKDGQQINNQVLGEYPDIGVRISDMLDFINMATTTINYNIGLRTTPTDRYEIIKLFLNKENPFLLTTSGF